MPSRAFIVFDLKDVMPASLHEQCLNALAGIYCFWPSIARPLLTRPSCRLNALAGIYCFWLSGFGGAEVASACLNALAGIYCFWPHFFPVNWACDYQEIGGQPCIILLPICINTMPFCELLRCWCSLRTPWDNSMAVGPEVKGGSQEFPTSENLEIILIPWPKPPGHGEHLLIWPFL